MTFKTHKVVLLDGKGHPLQAVPATAKLLDRCYPCLRWMRRAAGRQAKLSETLLRKYDEWTLTIEDGREWAEACSYPFAMVFMRTRRRWWWERIRRAVGCAPIHADYVNAPEEVR